VAPINATGVSACASQQYRTLQSLSPIAMLKYEAQARYSFHIVGKVIAELKIIRLDKQKAAIGSFREQ
jgi:hypothetical protein